MPALVTKNADVCRALGCGGLLRGIDCGDIGDGSGFECSRCFRWHTFTVVGEGGDAGLYVHVERAKRSKRAKDTKEVK